MAISKTRKNKQNALAISTDTYNEVHERDGNCALCKTIGLPKIANTFNMFECHHFIPRSRLGMGIPQNLVMLCKPHHDKVNFYKKELEEYMKSQYEDWDEESLRYKKYE